MSPLGPTPIVRERRRRCRSQHLTSIVVVTAKTNRKVMHTAAVTPTSTRTSRPRIAMGAGSAIITARSAYDTARRVEPNATAWSVEPLAIVERGVTSCMGDLLRRLLGWAISNLFGGADALLTSASVAVVSVASMEGRNVRVRP